MAEIDINFLPKSREFLEKFVNSYHKIFFDDMREYHPQKGYGEFPYSSKIVQCMRDLTHIIREVFSDLSIPGNFNTPTDLINQAKRFIDILESYESYFTRAIEKIVAKNKEATIPLPISRIDENRRRTIDVFRFFVNLAEIELADKDYSVVHVETPIEKIETLLKSFHNVATQLLKRRNEQGTPRATLSITDEYDVQDLLHALLKIFFSDIRPEEWAPSYAGSSKRTDFLIKKEQVVIEVKKTRANLKDKEIGEQLIIDIANYKKHPDCKLLVCFVYDPDKFITNPNGIENDLKTISENFTVLVYIIQY